jgi:hypothetical protein
MGRDRYQEGSLVLSGKRVKRWRGHFYVYRKHKDGREVRHFRNVFLGFKAEMEKGQAKTALGTWLPARPGTLLVPPFP